MTTRFKEFNEEVFYATGDIMDVSWEDVAFLKGKALANGRKRIRLCAHKDVNDALHEMLIIHTQGVYVRPHKHLNKSESIHVIEGSADVVIFDEQGKIAEAVPMGEYASKRKFYFRMSGPHYHTFIVHSKFFIFYETTKGPFQKADTIFGPWAPEENNPESCRTYMQKLSERIARKI